MKEHPIKPLHILQITASPDEGQRTILQLKQDGFEFECQQVDNEADFITALDWPPDLILSEYTLPQFDSLRALDALKEHKPGTPFILITRAMDEEQVTQALQQGASDCLPEDQLTHLSFIVQRALEQKRLRESSEKYRSIFDNSTIAIWEEDFSELKIELDKLRANGVTDFRNYIIKHPEFLEQAVQLVKVLDINDAVLRLYGAKDKSEILGSLGRLVEAKNFQEELIAFAEGNSIFQQEVHRETLQGDQLDLFLIVTYYFDSTGRQKALVDMTDITAHKKADDELRVQNEYLAILNQMNQAILLSNNYDATMQTLASNMKQIVKADDCCILRWNEERQLSIPVATTVRSEPPFTNIVANKIELSLTASILDAGHVIKIEDVSNSPYINTDLIDQYPTHSFIGAPLIAGNKKLGAAIITFNSRHVFTQDELERVEQAGNQVALALLEFQHNQEIQRSLKESETLAEIGRALSETERVGTDKVLQLIVDSALDLIQQAEESVIHILDAETDVLISRAISGFAKGKKEAKQHRVGLREGVARHVIATGETMNIGDIFNNPLYVLKEETPTHRSLLVAPVQSSGGPIGTISVQSSELNAFTTRNVELLKALSVQAAIAHENARLFEVTQQSLREVNALYQINQGLASSLDTDELLEDVVNLLQQNFGYYHAQIYLMDSSDGDLVLKSGSGEIGFQMLKEKVRLPRGTGIVGHVIETATPFFTNNVNDVMFFYRNSLLPDTQSEMAVPIMLDKDVMGVIDIQDRPPKKLTENDLQLMVAVAEQLSVALQKANLYTNLQTALKQEQAIRSQLIQSERLAVVGRLLASVSHELNNPLQAIQNALFLIKDDEQLSSQGKQDLEVILSEAERMASLIERLRSAYRPGRIKNISPVNLNDLIEDVHTLIATHMRQKRIAFEFYPEPDLPPISGLPDQIRQVALNLFINAVEIMEPGGRLTIRTRSLPGQNEVLFTVKDTGPGIDPEILPQVFEAFITDKQTGTGLGLTITRDIIEQHFGRIEAENDPEGGAVFNIWLPTHNEKVQV